MAKMLVPALTLPVRGATEFVATIPVPASPSGGHMVAPGLSAPVGSSRCAPSGLNSPAGCPATRTGGSSSTSCVGSALSAVSRSNAASIAESYPPAPVSMGNMPLASPTPRQCRPLSFQWT